MTIVLVFEIVQVIAYMSLDTKPDFNSYGTKILSTLEGIIVYALFYMMCLCGPVDLAKIELLKTNLKFAGMLFGLLCGLQCIIEALFFESLIDSYLNKDFF